MEKVISSGVRLILLSLLVVSLSCGEKKSESTDAVVVEDTVEVDTTDLSNQEYPYAAEIFEYRSEARTGVELYGIYPFEDAPIFLVSFFGKTHLLNLNEELEADEGIALEDESNFSAIKLLEESEKDGIVSYGALALITHSATEALFRQSFTKRSLTIGKSYTCNPPNAKGELTLVPANDGYAFKLTVNASDKTCELKGLMRVEGNIGYFQGETGTTCKLVFLFGNESLQLHAISSDAACGCGVSTFKQVDFRLNQ